MSTAQVSSYYKSNPSNTARFRTSLRGIIMIVIVTKPCYNPGIPTITHYATVKALAVSHHDARGRAPTQICIMPD
jgi:hypothetical protein